MPERKIPAPDKLFAVYPGWVWSEKDKQLHYISFSMLCELYNVRHSICVDMSRADEIRGRNMEGLMRLTVREDGHYDKWNYNGIWHKS